MSSANHDPMFDNTEAEIPQPKIEQVDPEKPIFSFSRFRAYLSCGAQYDYIYNKRRPRKSDIALSVGSTLHFMAETFSQSQIDNNILDKDEIYARGEAYWKEETKNLDVPDAMKFMKFEEAKGLYDAYLPHLKLNRPKMVEQHMIFYPEGKAWGIQGIVDRVDEDDRICDIKTSGKTPFKERSTGKFQMTKMHPEQLITYAWMMREDKGIDVKEAYIDYVVKTKTPKIVTVNMDITEEAIDSVVNMFDRIYDAINAKVFPPNRASTFCSSRHCPFWVECTGLPE